MFVLFVQFHCHCLHSTSCKPTFPQLSPFELVMLVCGIYWYSLALKFVLLAKHLRIVS